MLSFLNGIPEWFGKVIDGIKVFLGGLYIRRSTRIETERDSLKHANKVKNKQLEIAADPPADPIALRDSMRRDDF